MTPATATPAPLVPPRARPAAPPPSYLEAEHGWRSWLLTHDHKRIGVMFLLATAVALFLGGAFAIALRTQLVTPEGALVTPATYNRLFTLHGVIMVFLFMIPAVPSGFGNFFLPIMIGARDVAFPKLNLASFYAYVLGSVLVLAGMLIGGTDTGWTFYPPYSAGTPMSLAPVIGGIFIIGLSSIMTAINFITTIHTLRAPGMTWQKVPLFVWTLYGTALIQLLATPVLGMTLALVGMDYAFDWGVFDPRRGGDPVLFQHLFWFYSHPAVYIMILPAMGVMSEVVSTFAHKASISYEAIFVSTIGIAIVGFLSWGHHLFTSGLSRFDAGFFGAASMCVAIFSAIKVFTWVGTLYRGSITFDTPMLYFFAFLFLFVFGGMTGVGLASTSLDVHWQDTYFVVAHFHFIMVGGVITSYLAALHYWFPKLTGRVYSEKWGLLSAALVFMGFFLTFFPQFLLGNAGMPRRYATYPARFQALHVLSSGGAWMLGFALALVLGYLGHAFFYGRRARQNPWHGVGYEWRTSSPPPVANFVRPLDPRVGPYDYDHPEVELAMRGSV